MKPTTWITLLLALVASLAQPTFAPAQVFTVTNAPPRVTLAWDPIPGMAFNIYMGVSSGGYTNVTSAGTNTQLSLALPARGVTYYFAATSVDTTGLESAYSNEVTYTAKLPPSSPNLHKPVTLIVETKPDLNATLWADAGMNWSLSPDQTNAVFRLRMIATVR